MTPSAYTPWPEGRPPHMVAVNPMVHEQPLDNIIRHHQETCEECYAWAIEHGDDIELWIYPHD